MVEARLRLMETLGFQDILHALDIDQLDYISFYNVYLKGFAQKHYPNPIKRMQFIPLVRELKLFDHLPRLDELTEKGASKEDLTSYIYDLVDRMYIQKEIDKVLDDNFMKVIRDIDSLVQEEYFACTGKQPKSSIFDKDKTGDKLGEPLEKEEAIAEHFMKEYRKKPSRELADAFRKVHEIPTFERISAIRENDMIGGSTEGSDTLFSSFPVESMD